MSQTVCEYPVNEKERIAALRRYEILDTPPDGSFDHLTRLAAYIFNVPIAIISLVDHDRIWFKSRFGVEAEQLDRAPGLCASAILSDNLYVVDHAAEDARTLSNPLVTGALGLRFYAAAPLHTQDGYNLGTFCVIDKKPRYFTEEQRAALPALAKIVIDELERRLSGRKYLQKIHAELEAALAALKPWGVGQGQDVASAVGRIQTLSQELAAKANPGPPK